MIEIRKGDSLIVAHARRELEMAEAFKKTEDYDGQIGRAALAVVKVFDEWTKGDPALLESIHLAFNQIVTGELLSNPTTDPDEWEAIEHEDQVAWRNKRSPFYMSGDAGVSWQHMGNGQSGKSKNHITGEVYDDADTTNSGEGTESDQGRGVKSRVVKEGIKDTPVKKSKKTKPKAGEKK